jgi:hypothetical protein
MASKNKPKPNSGNATTNGSHTSEKAGTETQPDNSKCTAKTGKDTGSTGIDTNE